MGKVLRDEDAAPGRCQINKGLGAAVEATLLQPSMMMDGWAGRVPEHATQRLSAPETSPSRVLPACQ